MEVFLIQKGETIIRSIEAGIRTSLRHHGGRDSLHTLITESSYENDVIFITILRRDGTVLYNTKNAPDISITTTEITELLQSDTPHTSIEKQTGIFTIYKRLVLNAKLPSLHEMGQQTPDIATSSQEFSNNLILMGLLTQEYDDARLQDVHHALFMGALLFLVGSAGLYILFMYHSIRVTNSTLANMQLYTENVIESIPVGLITLDGNQRIVSFNSKVEDILGKSIQTSKGKSLQESFPGCPLDNHNPQDSSDDYSVECTVKDGKNVTLQLSSSSLTDNDGKVIGTVLIIRDLSMIKDMELQLERSRRMAALGTMAAGIAHEIRNPLGTLRGFAHFFGNQENATEESQQFSELMISEVDRLNKNVSGLLQFSRPRKPQLEKVNLKQLFTKTSMLMKDDFSNKDISFTVDCDRDIEADGDSDLLLQVILNLLKNSLSATDPGGDVSLTASAAESDILLEFSDSGIGMTTKEKEKMFDPFFTTKGDGTGLGLAVSHQIIEQHNGEFEIVSTKGKGTIITIRLPQIDNKRDV